jgi:TPR repeat protein
MSAEQGNAFSQNNYGVCLEDDKCIAKRLSEALKYYKMSADQGNSLGQYNYGRFVRMAQVLLRI